MEWLFRFLIGGAVVSVFSVTGELFKPKTFSGLFGAAPSVAIATLALAFRQHDAAYVGTEGRGMVIGALAMFVYAAACVAVTKRTHMPVWLGAGLAWSAWFAVALGLLFLAQTTGVLS